jgi:type I restriction enzyme M protein
VLGGKDEMRDPRFKAMHKGEETSLVTSSSDGQMLSGKFGAEHGQAAL